MTPVDINPATAVRRLAGTDGSATALLYQGRELSYRELTEAAGRLAETLASGGVRDGDRVAYLGLNSPTFLITYLASCWLGAIFVPLNHRLTAEEVADVLVACEAHTMVAEPGHQRQLDAAPAQLPARRLLLADDDPAVPVTGDPAAHWERLSAALPDTPPARIPVERHSGDVAVLMYTSGTTGRPKGVILSHGNLWWNGLNIDSALGIRPGDTNLAIAPLFHIGALACFALHTLTRGGATVLSRTFDPAQALHDLVEHRVNALFAVPAMYAALARTPGFADADLSALRCAVVAGAPVPPSLIELYAAHGVLLQQAWGLTETAPLATTLPAARTRDKTGSAGSPMPFTEIRLVDPRTGEEITEAGRRGELCVRGPNVTAGYWRDPATTAAAFDADGWFHSGDIGHRDEDGFYYIVDRLKDMIIVAGENVLPAEVEHVLTRHPGVLEVAVIGTDDPLRGEAVTAVVVSAGDGPPPTLDELRTHAAGHLAAYKLPTRLVFADVLPRNGAGKLDKNRLRDDYPGDSGATVPDQPTADRDTGPDPAILLRDRLSSMPRADGIEVLRRLVRDLVAELSEQPDLDLDDAFTDVDFDSLMAIEFKARLQTATGLRVPATLVFDHPTPAAVAGLLTAQLLPDSSRAPEPAGADAGPDQPDETGDANEPIAIVGIGCRFPGGVASPEDLWDMVLAGRDGISDFPQDRGWDLAGLFDPDPDHPGTSYAREAGFLKQAADFDAEFFGISPREALAMDPQQRLLLETSWEALERGGLDPRSLAGSDTGVFTGIMYDDYGSRLQPAVPEGFEGHIGTGSAPSVASGRVSYVLGLEGPAVSMDTACSSSLTAIHLAVQSLRRGECGLALAGGVTVMATPSTFVEFSRQRGLAPDGRCKSFAEQADGTGWSEGVGVVVLERLSDAVQHGHKIWATVRGTAVNQDGASNGLTAPNGPAQQRVIRAALADARLEPSGVDAVEAHGTGTRLGDPIEAQALLATYGQDRDNPLLLGSVKSNLGHTQAAAGVAGVIKMVMAMRHGTVPRTLHVDRPSTKVDWTAGAVELASGNRRWPATGNRPRRAAVSAFGISGTNAHVILEQAAPQPAEPGGARWAGPPLVTGGPVLVPVSGTSPEALRDQAARLRAYAADPGLTPADLGWSTAVTRAALGHRAVVLAGEPGDVPAGLGRLSAPDQAGTAAGVVTGVARTEGQRGRTVLVFSGQGSQWPGMAVELWERSPLFAARMDECERALRPHVDWSLRDALRYTGADALTRPDVVQPALWAVMVSLAALWRAAGVEPDAVVGHSQGEIAAACVAGALSLEDGALVVARRSRLIAAQLAGAGGMVAVETTADEAERRLAGWPARLTLAASNGPASVVVSGDPRGLDELVEQCDRDGVRTRRIAVDYASHGHAVERIRAALLDALEPIRPRVPDVPMFSTLTGDWIGPTALDARYWYDNLRQPVRFAEATGSLLDAGFGTFVEVSPHPVLLPAIQDSIDQEAPARATRPAVLGSLKRDDGGPRRLLTSLATAFVHGLPLRWEALFAGTGAVRADLPTYAFQHRHYWLLPRPGHSGPGSLGQNVAGHPLLSASVDLADGEGVLLTGRLALASHPWLADHRVAGVPLVPGSALLEMVARAGDEVGAAQIRELTLTAPLAVPADRPIRLQVTVRPTGPSGTHEVRVYSAVDDGWTEHASGLLASTADGPVPDDSDDLTVWPPAGSRRLDTTDVYPALTELGHEYGPAFQGLRALWERDGDLFAEVELPDGLRDQATGYLLHPILLDAALHALPAAARLDGDAEPTSMPFSWTGVQVLATGATAMRVRIRRTGPDTIEVLAADPAGEPVAVITELATRPMTAAGPVPADTTPAGLFRLDWQPVAAPAAAAGELSRWALVGEADDEFTEAARYHDVAALLAAIDGGTAVPDVLVVRQPASPDHDDVPRGVREATDATLSTLRSLLSDTRFDDSRLLFITRGSVTVTGTEPEDLVAAAVRGLVRTARSEHPGRILLADTDGSAGGLITVLIDIGEPEFAVRDAIAYVPRLVPVTPGSAGEATADSWAGRLDPDGTVLIAGGVGGLGALLARRLVARHGVRHLLLASRHARTAAATASLVAELSAQGAHVRVADCDLADRPAVAALLAGIAPRHPLTAVVQSTGVLDDGVLTSLTATQLDTVLRSKVDVAWNLHELTADQPLRAFLLCSSATGILGSPGQGAYTAANAFLDALACHRAQADQPATSLAWGPWQQPTGMTSHLDNGDRSRWTRAGVVWMPTDRVLGLFDAAGDAGADSPALVPVDFDRAVLDEQARSGALPPVLRGLVRHRPPRRRSGTTARPVTKDAVRVETLQELVLDTVRAVLGLAPDQRLDSDAAFKDLGFDSLMAVELRNRLADAVRLRLPATLVFDHPSPAAVAGLLAARLSPGAADTPASVPANHRAGPDEAIAIVGIGCRFPGGVQSPEDLWDMVVSGRDAISDFPVDRGWDLASLFEPDPDGPGTSHARAGGFLERAAAFDADFFGISPREAMAMDPQQRLLLETSWEALERAGIDPRSLAGSDTGVFTGVMYDDYGAQLMLAAPDGFAGHIGTGSAPSVASGRVSYVLGLGGPAVSIDTACSSSLVAMHLAAQSLRRGECGLALAGGVTVMGTPSTFVEFSRQQGLSADGRCKAFADQGDGTGWGEGVGVVVLERLSDAVRLGHQVWGVLRGSAVNQDGASNGLTAPNGPAQQRVIRAALADARLEPADVDVVEAHGTGTRLGDPIEAQALLSTYGQQRGPDGAPLLLGSVKSNLGHAQAAAGMAGVIKMVMAMRHGTVPRTLHVDRPTTQVDWSAGAVELAVENRSWPGTGDRPRRSGVSSFGISGTNAHVILEQPALVRTAPPSGAEQRPVAVPVSGYTPEALRAQADRLRAFVAADPGLTPAEVGWSTATRRAALAHRAAVVATTRDELLTGLTALAGEQPATAATGGDGRVGWLFSGQGSQRAGMGAELHERFPVFATSFDEVAGLVGDLDGHHLSDVIRTRPELLDETRFAQPALFAVQVALARLWESWDVRPNIVTGHSLGGITAAHLAGVLSLPDAVTLVTARARLMQALPAGGTMIAVAAAEDEALAALTGHDGKAALAAINAPGSVVLSGDEATVLDLARAFERQGRSTRRLRVSHAFHSPAMDPMLDDFRSIVTGLSFRAPKIPVVSELTGQIAEPSELTSSEYWVRHARATVRFADAVATLRAERTTAFLEIGPDAVLTGLVRHNLTGAENETVVPSLYPGQPETETVLHALARLYATGVAPDWRELFDGTNVRAVDLPTYAFQHRDYWLHPQAERRPEAATGLDPTRHPLLVSALPLAQDDGAVVHTGLVSTETHPWLAEHTVHGVPVLPGAAVVDLFLTAGADPRSSAIEDLTLHRPVALPETGGLRLQLAVAGADRAGRRKATLYCRPDDADAADGPWTLVAEATLGASFEPDSGAGTAPLWPPASAVAVDLTGWYERLAAHGYGYGPAFQGLRGAWRDGDDWLVETELPEQARAEALPFEIHPVLLDAVFQPLTAAASGPVRLPFSWQGVRLHTRGATRIRVRVSITGPDTATLSATDTDGTPILTVAAVTTREATPEHLVVPRSRTGDAMFTVAWPTARPGRSGQAGALVVTGPDTGLAARIEDAGRSVVVLESGAPVAGDVYLPVELPETGPDADQVETMTAAVLGTAQTWLADDARAGSRLVVVTRSAVSAVPDDEVSGVAQSAVWGLIRAAQQEHPGRFVLADLDDDPASLRLLDAAVGSGAVQFALRRGEMRVPRLERAAAPPTGIADVAFPADGTVLVTGGTGGVGRALARHLAEAHGVRHLLLVGRRPLDEAASSRLTAEFGALGATVTAATCDVRDRDALRTLLAGIPPEHPLTAAVHAAGVLDDGMFQSLTGARLTRVLAAKARGAWLLHELTREHALTAFVLVSSISGALGAGGQAGYSAANAFLDALAGYRRARGLPAVAMAWGRWDDTGMAGDLDAAGRARMDRAGVTPMRVPEALSLFDAGLRLGLPAVVLSRLDLPELRRRAARGEAPVSPLLDTLVSPGPHPATAPENRSRSSAELLRSAPPPERQRLLLKLVRENIAEVMGHPIPTSVGVERGLLDLGFDSLMAVELRNRLVAATAVPLPVTTLFDHPGAAGLATYLSSELARQRSEAVLTGISDWEAELTTLDLSEETRAVITDRLGDILLRLRSPEANGGPGPAATDITGLVDAAAGDELFELIDRHLGSE
ncbi:SDR family NAD(P)-dependent oxidoreductase [Actinoplanes sp. NPDC049265]|uniref:SDR family NAD(P)-dependent oxidoreductase n=1 Tax=Actinoplanes sp. NPDC049265 TaxID=3363902 RepID=UPI0037211C4E